MSIRSYDVTKLRADEFPWTLGGETIYLNNAGTGPLPRRTVAASNEWNALRTQPWRTTDHDVVFPALARTRASCARLLNAYTHEIALVSNTSFGLNLAARALPLKQGDIVIGTKPDTHALVPKNDC